MKLVRMFNRKIFFCFCFFLFFASIGWGQLRQLSFERHFGGESNEQIYSITNTLDTGYVVAGYTESFGTGLTKDMLVVKMNKWGATEWSKTFEAPVDQGAAVVRVTPDRHYIVGGFGETTGGYGGDDIIVRKVDSLGNQLWQKIYGEDASDKLYSLESTFDNGYILLGITYSFNSGDADMYLIKIDSLGNELWSKTYGGNDFEIGTTIKETYDKGFIIAGNTTSFGAGEREVLLIKTDSLGIVEWSNTYGENGIDGVSDVIETPDTSYIIVGGTGNFGSGDGGDMSAFKTDSLGALLWSKKYEYDNSFSEMIFSANQVNDTLIALGANYETPLSEKGVYAISIYPMTGEVIGGRKYKTDVNTHIYDGEWAWGGGLIFSGYYDNGIEKDGYLLKTNHKGETWCNDSIVHFQTMEVGTIVTSVGLNTQTVSTQTVASLLSSTDVMLQNNLICELLEYDELCGAYKARELLVQFKEDVSDDMKMFLREESRVISYEECVCNRLEKWIFEGDGIANNDIIDIQTIREDVENSSEVEEGGASFNYRVRFLGNSAHPQSSISNQWSEISEQNNLTPTMTGNMPNDLPIRVAIIDTGVSRSALDAFIWLNPNPIDDENCVDDPLGYNYYDNNANAEDDHPSGHGTAVAGRVINSYENGGGIDDYDTRMLDSISLHRIKAFGADNNDLFSLLCSSLDATQAGDRIINISAGYIGEESMLSKNVFKTAKDAGVLVVCSAGNEGKNTDNESHFPSGHDLDNILSVGAIAETEDYANYSNFGKNTVDVAALGSASCLQPNGVNKVLEGTSIAAPTVSGLAATLWARNPALTYCDIIDLIESSVEVRPELATKVKTSGIINHQAAYRKLQTHTPLICNLPSICEDNLVLIEPIEDSFAFNAVEDIRSNGSISNDAIVTYTAGEEIDLMAEFEVTLGSVFEANIAPVSCNNPPSNRVEDNQPLNLMTDTQKAQKPIIQCYPNPFSSTTTISYFLQDEGYIQIDVYDIRGQRVRQIVNHQYHSLGLHQIDFFAETMQGGMYFVQLWDGQYRVVHKMVVVK